MDTYVVTLHSLSAVARSMHTNVSRIVRAERKARIAVCGSDRYPRKFMWESPKRYDVQMLAFHAGLIR